EPALPQTVGNDRDAILPGLIFFFQKDSALEGPNTHYIEKVCRDEITLDVFRSITAGEICAPPSFQGEMFKRLVLRAPVEIIRHGNFDVLKAAARAVVPNSDDAIEIRKRQRLKQQGVHTAEDGAVSANAQRQSDDGDRGESGPLKDASDCVTKIVEKRFHDCSFLGHS